MSREVKIIMVDVETEHGTRIRITKDKISGVINEGGAWDGTISLNQFIVEECKAIQDEVIQ